MARSRGIGGYVKAFIILTILCGIAAAILSMYNWDPVEAMSSLMGKVADFLLQFAWFREIFGP